MRMIVFPGRDGQISASGKINGQPLPERAVVVDVPREPGPHEVFYLVEGRLDIRYDYRGSGPWYDQKAALSDRLTPRDIIEVGIVPPNEHGHPVNTGWEHMAMMPRAETSAEKKAREKAEADAAAAKEAERIANIEVGSDQLAEACFLMKLLSAEEAAAWGGAGVLPQPLGRAIDTLADDKRELAKVRASSRLRYKRNDRLFEEVMLAVPDMTPAGLDHLFVLADSLR